MFKFAIAGNPNSGKTTLFNAITGARHKVANWPGVTVEKKSGVVVLEGVDVEIIDLPGTYSLSNATAEESVARDFILNENPDVIINVVDVTNLERNLYLTTLLMEMGKPMVIALNMYDVINEHGGQIDLNLFSELIGIPVFAISATEKSGTNELLKNALQIAQNRIGPKKEVRLRSEVYYAVKRIEDVKKIPRWLSLKLLENDEAAFLEVAKYEEYGKIKLNVMKEKRRLERIFNEDCEALIAEDRYGFIKGLLEEIFTKKVSLYKVSETVDRILLNKFLGLPIFLIILWLTFNLTFGLGHYPGVLIEKGFDYLGTCITSLLGESLLQNFLVEGIIGGVGGVIIYLPNILLLFLAIAFLEDTGYMARAAFLMDKLMHLMRLHGKSFIPLFMGYGCTVPAVMATRMLESKRDRILTTLIIPFMSCCAKLPVYTLLISAFFPEKYRGSILFAVYLFGVVVAAITTRILDFFFFKKEAGTFVMELPPYRAPAWTGLLIHMWDKAIMYLRKATSIILLASVILWAVSNLPYTSTRSEERFKNSIAFRLGHYIEPAVKPIGFDSKIAISLIGGFAAKEIIVSTLSTLYKVEDKEDKDTADTLRTDPHYSMAVALSLLVFTLLYAPCLPSLLMIGRELNSKRWVVFLFLYTNVVAYVFSLIIYKLLS